MTVAEGTVEVAGKPGPSHGLRRRLRREAALAYVLLVPALVLFGAFSFYPFFRNFKLMLYETPPVPGLPAHYVGLHQIIPTITSTQFTQSLVTTVIFVALVVPISLILGLALAVAAHRKLKGMAVYRMIFSSTVVSSVAVASVIFGTLLNPVVGLLPWLGINPSPPALESTTWALPAVAVITIWQFLGLSFIIMSAGLQSVPDELLEAARIDGANAWTRFWRMTVPLLSPTIFFAVIVSTIYAFQAFGAVDILIGNTECRPPAHQRAHLQHRQHAADREQPGRRRHHGDGPVPHHAGPDPHPDASLGAAGELCPLTMLPARPLPDTPRPPRAAPALRTIGSYALLTAGAIVVLFPIYVTIVNSLLVPDQLVQQPPPLFPTGPQWHNYVTAWTSGSMSKYMATSAIMTMSIVVGQLVTSILAAYAFAFLRFPFKRTLFVICLATLMIPLEVTFITNLDTITTLHWFNSYEGLAVPFLATGFGIFLLRQAFLQIPRDLQEAAQLDGYGHLRFMTRVAVPLARPSLAALGVFSFLAAWNQYLWPLVATGGQAPLNTVQIGLKQLIGTQVSQIPVALAGAVIAFVPLVILLLVFQKQLVRSLTAGAVK